MEYSSASVHGIHEPNALTRAFFSEKNIDRVQQCIVRKVNQESQGRYSIGRQSDRELFIIMRSIYFQYADNRPTHIAQQVKQLNRIVVDECVPKILSNAEMHFAYLRRASGQDHTNQIERPIYVSSAGSRTLPSVMSLYT
tara:strand:- start:874 stop:1293 length:420 start_codon:yes stop_codon:yes gene_type:complete